MSMAPSRDKNIKPIASDVAAKIIASSAVNSLSDVVLGLVRNALEAGASQISVALSFDSGSCSVEDNGKGLNISKLGSHNQLMLPSNAPGRDKVHASQQNWCFLECLAALSSLTIISKTSDESCVCSLSSAFSSILERHTPAPSKYFLDLRIDQSGSKILVNSLFKQLPVRFQGRDRRRPICRSREREDFRYRLISFLLAFHRRVDLTLFDEDDQTKRKINLSTLKRSTRSSLDIEMMFLLLVRFADVEPDSKASWVPISASTRAFKLRGAISLNPAPSQYIQFISMGNEPLHKGDPYQAFYNVVNEVFQKSSFGTIAQDDTHEKCVPRRQQGRKCEEKGFTSDELRKHRKSLEEWPMFYIRLEPQQSKTSIEEFVVPKHLKEHRTASVVHLLGLAATQWLREHSFRPHKWQRHSERYEQKPHSRSMTAQSFHGQSSTASFGKNVKANPNNTGYLTDSSDRNGTTSFPVSNGFETRKTLRAWSRIKRGEQALSSDFYTFQNFDDSELEGHLINACTGRSLVDKENTLSLGQSSAAERFPQPESPEIPLSSQFGSSPTETSPCGRSKNTDSFQSWCDTTTGKRYLFNARSGMLQVKKYGLPILSSKGPRIGGRSCENDPDCSDSLQYSAAMKTHRRLSNCIYDWRNPIFAPKKTYNIPIFREKGNPEGGFSGSLGYCRLLPQDRQTVFPSSGSSYSQVLSQVDEKYLLIKCTSRRERWIVILDQHAASERVILEDLLGSFRGPAKSFDAALQTTSNAHHGSLVASTCLKKPVAISLTPRELELCKRCSTYFARWGIFFDLDTMNEHNYSDQDIECQRNTNAKILSLPLIAAERYAAAEDAVRELFRGILHSKKGQESAVSISEDSAAASNTHEWLRSVGDCPDQILDTLTSRACRSAIMFNDVLSADEGQKLVDAVSRCAFPLLCAHGRPSAMRCYNWTNAPDVREDAEAYANFLTSRVRNGRNNTVR